MVGGNPFVGSQLLSTCAAQCSTHAAHAHCCTLSDAGCCPPRVIPLSRNLHSLRGGWWPAGTAGQRTQQQQADKR